MDLSVEPEKAFQAVGLLRGLLKSSAAELLQTERADEVLGVELFVEGGDAAAVNDGVTRGANVAGAGRRLLTVKPDEVLLLLRGWIDMVCRAGKSSRVDRIDWINAVRLVRICRENGIASIVHWARVAILEVVRLV